MKFNYFTTNIPLIGLFSLVFLMASCGSYEYVGYDNDGIYGQDERITVEYPPQQQPKVETRNDGTYYKNYFSEKAKEYEFVFSDDEIFTDIDSYEGDYDEEIDSLNYNKSYAGWGQTNSSVTINVIDRGWGAWGWYDPWFYSPWMYNSWSYYRPWRWGPSYGWGWNNWGWNNWGWNAGFYWGWNNWGHGYAYYGVPNYNNYYGNYNRRGIAYNAGRRGSYLNRNYSTLDSRSLNTSRFNRNSTVRSRSSNRSYENNNRSTRPRSTTRPNSPRRERPEVSSPRRSSSRSSGSINRSSSSRRSSGSINRSSGSSRSSSGSRSSGSSRSSSSRSSSRK